MKINFNVELYVEQGIHLDEKSFLLFFTTFINFLLDWIRNNLQIRIETHHIKW